MKKVKVSITLNAIISVLVLLGTIFMLTGIKFMSKVEFFSSTRLGTFKFFTVDSNIFFGIVTLIFLIYEIKLIKGKIKEIPLFMYLLKLISTVEVTLTFLVTLFFLAPTSKFSFFAFYQNSNLFFHFIVPILGLISFIFFEKTQKMPYHYTFYGLVPMILYSIFYSINVLSHITNGRVGVEYDFYGFLKNGTNNILLVIIIMIVFTYTISYILWKLNKINYEEKK